ncbi:MAG: hypothetical protein ACLU3I_02895 [Acutalibacteraceae bacterium]
MQATRVVKSFVRGTMRRRKFSAASDSVRKDFLKAEKILALNSRWHAVMRHTSMILISYFAREAHRHVRRNISGRGKSDAA